MISGNVTVSLALRLMKSVKRATVIFLANLAVSNLVQSIIFLFRAIFFLWHINTVNGCLFMQMLVTASTGSYMMGILYIYLDLYISLKKMSVSKPVISSRMAVIMCSVAWMIWLCWGAIGYIMRNVKYKYNHEVGCSVSCGVYTKEYILFIAISLFAGFLAIFLFHILSYRLIKKAQMQQAVAAAAGHQSNISTVGGSVTRQRKGKTSHWLKKNEAILKMIILVLIIFIICFYPVVIFTLVIFYCTSCAADIRKEVLYVVYLLVAFQYNSNGFIYLIKIPEFQDVFRRFCCRKLVAQRRVGPIDINREGTKIRIIND